MPTHTRGVAIRHLRRELRVSQDAIAQRLGCDRSLISRIESGERNTGKLSESQIRRAILAVAGEQGQAFIKAFADATAKDSAAATA